MKKIFFISIIFAIALSLSAPVFAAECTWTGAGADNESENVDNWVGGVKSTTPVDTLIFGTGGSTANITNSIYQNAYVTFNRAADFTITATGFGVFGIGGATASTDGITAQTPDANNRTYTISAPVKLYQNQTWTVSNNGVNTTTLAVSGAISGAFTLTKAGAGTLILTGANTYSDATKVGAGTLILSGASGAINSSAGLVIFGGSTLKLDNTAAANNTNRLKDTGTVAMYNGTLNFSNDASDTSFSETTGAVTIATGVNTISASEAGAGVGGASALTLGTLTRTAGATVNFSGTDLGTTTRNQILLTHAIGFIDQGTFLNGSNYAWMHAANTYVRAINYGPGPGTDALTVTVGTGATIGAYTDYHVQITGAITAQTDITIPTLKISGAYNFVIADSNTVTVNGILKSGANSATISGGTGIMANNAELVIRTDLASDALTISTPILANGTSSLTKSGAGTLTLSGINTYTGDTTLNEGTLNLNNSTSPLGTGAIIFSGIGGVTIDNTSGAAITNTKNNLITMKGDLIFTGTNDLNIGTGAMTLNDSGTFTVNGSTLTIGGIIAGGGYGFEKLGIGTLALNGVNTYTGGTTISAGTLIAGSSSALGTGAVTNNATLDIGSNNVSGIGVYTQNASGSKLKVTVDTTSTSGKLSSTTAAVVTAAGSVDVTIANNIYIPNGATFTIIDTTGTGVAVPGTINSITTSRVAFLGSASNGDLILTANRSSTGFASLAANSNASAAGNVLDNISSPSSDMTTVLNALEGLNNSQTASALNSTTPTTDGAVTQSSTAMLNNFINNLGAHLENVRATGGATGVATGDGYLNGVDVWAQGLGDYAHQDPRGSSNGYNATSWGISGGLDKALFNDSIRLGLGSGYGQTFVRSKDFSGHTDIDSIPATIYCDYVNNNLPFYIDAAFTFIYNMYTGSRQITAGPTITRTANADYNGQQYSGYIEGGYSFFYKKLSLTPLASFQYAHLHTGSYTETNAGALNLSVASQDYDMAETGLGAKLACPFDNKYGTFTPDLHFKWLYDWVGDKQTTTSSFMGGGTSFGTNGFNPAQSAYDFGAKLNFKTKYNVIIGLDYDFLFKADYYEHYGVVDVKYSF